MSLLELEGVHSYYGPSHILRGVSLHVDEGEIVALLGRNGAGKTTTLRSIVGAHPPEVREGTIRYGGTDITDWPTDDIVLSGVGIVPEERRLFTELTVAENLELSRISRSYWNVIRRKVLGREGGGMGLEELYDLFPALEQRQEQKAGTLSGGEQQMLSIARTLRLPNVDLLLLDEPTEGLAPQIIEGLVCSIERIAEGGTTVLLIEQNVQATLDLATRGYILDQGEIVMDGPVDEFDEAELDRYLVM
jgi:branched-chain amino acid transport system ATP-binding protein